MLFVALALAFVAAQGGAVFALAYIGLRLLRQTRAFAKIIAMMLSYVAWITFTVFAYTLTGDDGSFMKGGSILLALCVTAGASSFAYLIAWVAWPVAGRLLRPPGGVSNRRPRYSRPAARSSPRLAAAPRCGRPPS